MTMPTDDHMSKRGDGGARRIEVFTGAGRRREWSAEQKATILAESYQGTSSVCDVARRHGLTPTQLFTWRRAVRRQAVEAADQGPEFVPAMIEAPTSAPKEQQTAVEAAPLIGFDLDGARVWVCSGADASMVTAIIRALKAPK
ncbi:MAG TPA: transposase [Stellaceae bacterium]|nr:transposase [Stellaceae bacterium]